MTAARTRICIASVVLSLASSAGAATLTVTTPDDDFTPNGNCTLREAVIAANTGLAVDACGAGDGVDTILLGAGTYLRSLSGYGENAAATGDLDVWRELTITGVSAEQTVIDADRRDRVFEVLPGATLALTRLTLRGGRTLDFSSGGGIANAGQASLDDVRMVGHRGFRGGAIWNAGQLEVRASRFEDNVGAAAALWNEGTAQVQESSFADHLGSCDRYGCAGDTVIVGTSASSMVLESSSVSGNGFAGVAFAEAYPAISTSGALVVRESTVSGNAGVGVRAAGPTLLEGVTLAGNGVTPPTDVQLLVADGGELTMARSLVVGSCRLDGGALVSGGGNLESPGDGCGLDAGTDLVAVPDAGLGSLALNGGPTPTHRLLPGSVAVDALDPGLCPAIDQRGEPRPRDGDLDSVADCDIGAYELCDGADVDGDGTADGCDSCPADANPSQEDGDGDGWGDACDICPAVFDPEQDPADSDGDGAPDTCDVCPERSDPAQLDTDGDGLGDVCDICPEDHDPDQEDRDGDGIGDACDSCTDADRDGYGIGRDFSGCPHPEERDCDDSRWRVNPGKIEIPGNGIDDDCNPSTPVGSCEQTIADGPAGRGGAGLAPLLLLGVVAWGLRRRPRASGVALVLLALALPAGRAAAEADGALADPTHRLDGRLLVRVFKDTDSLASGFAHDHVVRAGSFDALARIDPEASSCELAITVRVEELVVDEAELRHELGLEGEIDAGDRDTIRESMLAEGQLDAERHPFVRFRSTGCTAPAAGEPGVTGDLTLRGVTRRVELPFALERQGETLSATAELEIRGSDFGMEPYRALFGAVRNRDDLTLVIELVATPL